MDKTDRVLNEINDLFLKGESATTARHVFLKQLRLSCKDDLEFHIKRANRLYAPRKRDFFHLYETFVKEKFGGHDSRMFDKLEESLLLYKETHPQSKSLVLVEFNDAFNTIRLCRLE